MERASHAHKIHWSIQRKQISKLNFHSLLKAKNVVAATPAMRAASGGDLSLRRVSWNIIVVNDRLRDPRPFFAQPVFKPKSMAQNADSQSIESELDEGKVKEAEKQPKVVLPPPPEKPLPGDCCGSGCVRCVWDIYYEELEEYKKLHKQDSTSKS